MASTSPNKAVSNLLAPDKVGWLEKRGKVRKNWTRRYFVLKDNELKYYKSDKPTERSQGKIILDGCTVEIAPESKYGRKFCFELTAPLQNRIFVIVAENGTSLQEWMNAIRRAMLRLRRERSKTEAAQRRKNKVDGVDSDSERSANESDGPSPPPSIADSVTNRSSLSGAISEHPQQPRSGPNSRRSSAENATSAAKKNDGKDDDKYGVYLQWLEETKDGRSRKSIVGKREGDGSVLHRHLLDEEQQSKKGCSECCSIS